MALLQGRKTALPPLSQRSSSVASENMHMSVLEWEDHSRRRNPRPDLRKPPSFAAISGSAEDPSPGLPNGVLAKRKPKSVD